MQKMIYVVKIRSSIESQENNDGKDDIIDTIQKMKQEGDKEKGIIKKGIVKEMLETVESQQTNSKDGTLRKELDIGKDIVKQRNVIKKEKKDDSAKEFYERQNNEIIRRKFETKVEIGKGNKGGKNNYGNLKEKANSDSVVKVEIGKEEVVNKKDKKCNSLKEIVDETL